MIGNYGLVPEKLLRLCDNKNWRLNRIHYINSKCLDGYYFILYIFFSPFSFQIIGVIFTISSILFIIYKTYFIYNIDEKLWLQVCCSSILFFSLFQIALSSFIIFSILKVKHHNTKFKLIKQNFYVLQKKSYCLWFIRIFSFLSGGMFIGNSLIGTVWVHLSFLALIPAGCMYTDFYILYV